MSVKPFIQIAGTWVSKVISDKTKSLSQTKVKEALHNALSVGFNGIVILDGSITIYETLSKYLSSNQSPKILFVIVTMETECLGAIND